MTSLQRLEQADIFIYLGNITSRQSEVGHNLRFPEHAHKADVVYGLRIPLSRAGVESVLLIVVYCCLHSCCQQVDTTE